MRAICAAIVIYISLPLSVGFGQNIPTDADAALLMEWKAPPTALDCLAALRIYATLTIEKPGGVIYLTPDDVEKEALHVLLRDIPDDRWARFLDLYTVAQSRSDFLDRLAKASSIDVPEETLFNSSKGLIGTIYDQTGGKQALAAVQAAFDQKQLHLALFRLLHAYPRPYVLDADYTYNLEILRAAYKKDPATLFNLVTARIKPN